MGTEEAKQVEQSEDDLFDAAFAERAEKSEPVDDDQDAPGEVGAGDAAAEDAQQFEESFKDAAQGAAPEKDPEPKEEDLATRIARVEAENEKLRQSDKSQRGRVSALTKKLMEQRAAEKPPVAAPVESGDNSDWEEFQREFPEMAAVVDKRLSGVVSRVEAVSQKVERVATTHETLVEKEIANYKAGQFDVLAERHSDFEEIKISPEFRAWREKAPADMQARIKSQHADDAIKVLDAYKLETGLVTKPVGGKSEVELINERRATNLKRSAGISSKKVGHSANQSGSDDDFDAAFAGAASKKEKMRSARY